MIAPDKNYSYSFTKNAFGETRAVLLASIKGIAVTVDATYNEVLLYSAVPKGEFEAHIKSELRRRLMSMIEREIFGEEK